METHASWEDAGLGLCLKVATRVLELLDDAADAGSAADAAELSRLQDKADQVAERIFRALTSPDANLH